MFRTGSDLAVIRAVNVWCREHAAWLVMVDRGNDYHYRVRVILSDGDDMIACERSKELLLAELDAYNDRVNGPRTPAEVHRAVMAGLVGME